MKVVKQIVKFGLVGVVATILSISIQMGMIVFFDMSIYVAIVIGFLLSSIFTFSLNLFWVFEKKKIVVNEIVKFYTYYSLVYIVLGWVLAYFWINILGIPEVFAPILSQGVQTVVIFILNKFLIFKK